MEAVTIISVMMNMSLSTALHLFNAILGAHAIFVQPSQSTLNAGQGRMLGYKEKENLT